MLLNSKGGLTRRKNRGADGDLDITPMIDVTFLLLIFFMVTSTMKGTPDKAIPSADTGQHANASAMLKLSIIRANNADGGVVNFEDRIMSLEELQNRLTDHVRGGPVELIVYAERGVTNGYVGDVEAAIAEIEGNVTYRFAVMQLR